jgi:hypothetical protein
MEERALLPGGASIIAPDQSSLIRSLALLAEDRDKVAARGEGLQPPASARYAAAVARFDLFFANVTAADANGKVPLAVAARLEKLLETSPFLLRVYVEKAGGSVVTRKNIWTFFWADPVRVSGGLVASYVITDPNDSRVLAADVIISRTRVAKMSEIQKGSRQRAAEGES